MIYDVISCKGENYIMSYKRILFVLAVLITTLFIILIIRKVFKSYFLNKITNILVYLIELYLAGTLISLLLYKETFQIQTSFLLVFKNYVFANSIYQIILNMILKFWDGTTIDAYNSLQTALKRIKLYSSNKDKLSEYFIVFKSNVSKLNNERSYNKSALSTISNVNLLIDKYLNNNLSESEFNKYLDDYLISIENEENLICMGWQNSLFLRMDKKKSHSQLREQPNRSPCLVNFTSI